MLSYVTSFAQLSFSPIWKLNYEMAFPTGEMNSEFINSAGWRGFSLKANWFVAENLALGAVTGYNGFYQKDARQTYTSDNVSITGTRMKYLYTMPLLASVQYIHTQTESYNLYGSFALGPYWIQQEDQIGRFVDTTKSWKFGFNPEVGILIPFNIDVGFSAGLGYHHIFYSQNNLDNLSYISLSVGLYFN